MNHKLSFNTVNTFWDEKIIPVLTEYIKIPNKSPSFDRHWKKNGHMDMVLQMAKTWTQKHLPKKNVTDSAPKAPIWMNMGGIDAGK